MKYINIVLIALFCSCASAPNEDKAMLKYPDTKKTDYTDKYFDSTVADPYRWLENDTSAETKQWVAEENKVTQGFLGRIPFRDAIKTRLNEIWNYENFSIPFKEGGYTYFYKNDGLQNQSVLYRQKGEEAPEVFLDPNKFSAEGTTALSGIDFSHDGSLLAYTISEGGSDWNKLIAMRADTKEIISDTIAVKFTGLAWKGNEGFYYSTYDKPIDGSQLSGKTVFHKLYYHKIGTRAAEDKMIFGGEGTPRRYIRAYVTEDQNFLVIDAANATYGNETYLVDLKKDDLKIKPVITGFDTEESVVYADSGKLFILTNYNAPNRKLVVVDAANPARANWKDLIPETKFPLSVNTAGGKIFAMYVKDAVSQVIQFSLSGVQEKEIAMPGPGSAGGFFAKKEDGELYYSFTSYLFPATIYKYDIKTGSSSVFKKPAVKFKSEDFESKQVFYQSKDGTKIPMIITHKKGLQLNGNNPTVLYGYGGFNVSLTPSFSTANIVFLENGGIYAVPNIRGGGEYGDAWHNAGIKMKKQNVFDDFIAAAEYLIKEKYTSTNYLAILGGSNGGLLVGACMTQRPELFKVCFPAVGVMDMLRYNQFTAGAGWAYDYGTSSDSREMFAYLLKYSPLHALKAGTCYPATLVTTADHDDRVVPAHSFKFAATLQASQSCDKPVLIRIETKAGHGAGMSTAKMIEDVTDRWSFLFYNMGLTYPAKP